MSFKVTRVGYLNFRSMGDFVLEPGPRLTILVGPNAAGKTNCIEGLQILLAGTSFRHAAPSELIRQGSDAAGLRILAEGEKRTLDVAYDIFPSKKLLSVNGKRRPNAEGRGILPSVLFYPDELLVVKGPASGRRELVDDFGETLNKSYARVSTDYRRALYQRNSLLKAAVKTGQPIDEAVFFAWTESLVASGAMLVLYRRALLDRLAPHIERLYGELSGGEVASVAYQSAYLPEDCAMGSALPSRDEVAAALRARLEGAFADEQRRAQTLHGPHLDDVVFSIDGKNARAFGSQGQQRSLVLAVKMAQVGLVKEMLGQYPLFLLDDVMSELDARRRHRLFDLIQGGMQTIVTTANLEYFGDAELAEAKVVNVGGGQ